MTDISAPSTPAQLAEQAAENIRALNHVTLPGRGELVYPSDAYSTVANLSDMAMRLPQALQQIRAFIDRLDEHQHLRSDHGPDDLAQRLADLRAALTDAEATADTLYNDLARAHAALGPIAWQD